MKVSLFAATLLVTGVALAEPPPVFPKPLLEACEGKQVNGPCEVSFGKTKKQGACLKLEDGTLACMQKRTPKPPKKPKP